MRKIIIQQKKLLKLTGALKHIITKYYACSNTVEHALTSEGAGEQYAALNLTDINHF